MMLFKLSIKNIKKSIKDYAIYFFTLILGVAIFYVFNSIDSQTVMMNVSENTNEIIRLMTELLSGVSVFVSFVLGFLIIYASRFLIKRRKKEFGIYLTLGMSKGKISKILLFETILIGTISLFIGLGLGVIVSQFMSIIVANMFEADMTKFTFIFSYTATIKTIVYFGIMYLLVMFFNVFSVGKCKLIDLIHANKKSEQVKMKNSYLCIIVFLIAASMLGYAYYQVTANPYLINQQMLLTLIAMGSIATFLLFWSLSGLILKLVMSFKGIYNKGLNSFILRQVSSKVNTTVFSMTIICLMLFLTIGILSSAISIKNSMTNNLKKLSPVDINVAKTVNRSEQNSDEFSRTSIEQNLEKMQFSAEQYLKDKITFSSYYYDDITFKDVLGSEKSKVEKQFSMLNLESKEEIMKLSDYNKVAKLYGNETYELEEDEYIIIADFESIIAIRNNALKKKTNITVNGHRLKPKYEECKEGFVSIGGNQTNIGIILVQDDIIEEKNATIEQQYLIANYKENNKQNKQEIESYFKEMLNKERAKPVNYFYRILFNTKIDIYESSIGLSAMITFIGIYLGIIFLISSAAILALKELSESSDNKERYLVLRKIGADEKMIRHALFAQIAIFFLFPLLIAILHSIFGIQFANQILIIFGKSGFLPAIISTALILILIYGGYFLITYYCSKNIIRSK